MLISFFFNDPPTTEIYTLSLHDAPPILSGSVAAFAHFTVLLAYALREQFAKVRVFAFVDTCDEVTRDRKSTRLNSSHVRISYAVFCLKKKRHDARRLA